MTQSVPGAVNESDRYLTLEVLRGVGAIAVMLGHMKMVLGIGAPFYSGYLAVDIFFMLSGFVIAYAYGEKLMAGMSVARFMLIRMIRLWPMVLLGTLLAGVRLLLLPLPDDFVQGHTAIGLSVLLNALFLPVPPNLSHMLFPTDDPQWSLFFELAVNLVFALGAMRLRGWPLGILLLILFVLELALVGHYGRTEAGFYSNQYPAGLVRAGFPFAIGVVLYHLRDRIVPLMPRIPVLVMLVVTSILLSLRLTGMVRMVYDFAFVAVLGPLLIACAARVQPKGVLRHLALWLGAISYPLYLLHYPFVQAVEALTAEGSTARIVAVVVAAVVLPMLSTAVMRYYDAPMRAWLRRMTRRPRPQLLAETA